MTKVIAIISHVLALAALSGPVAAMGSDPLVQAKVRHVVATVEGQEDPDVAAFKLEFDLQLINRSETTLEIPKFEVSDHDVIRTAILAVQLMQPGGAWTNLVQSSLYDVGTSKHDACASVSPLGRAEIRSVVSGFPLLRKQLTGLGRAPNVRLKVMLFCRQPNGRVVTTAVTTDPFSLRLPRSWTVRGR